VTAESGKIKLIVKNHTCARIGEIASWASFDCVSRVNDVGDAVLVAGWGASGANDNILDSLDTVDTIIEAYIKPPGHKSFLPDPVWAGFLRKFRIRRDSTVKVGTFMFKDYNHLLARRIIMPPSDASHAEEHDTTANVMRNLVRKHAGEDADSSRQFPGLLVEENDETESGGLYGDAPEMTFGSGLPEWIRVNCMYEWGGDLYIGTETQSSEGTYAGIFRTGDGITWTQVYDGGSGLYAESVTGVHCFAEFDGALWAGCSQDWESGKAAILKTTDGTHWILTAELPNKAGVWALQEFDGNFYAGTSGQIYAYDSKVWLWSSPDGVNWTEVFDADDIGESLSSAICRSLYVKDTFLYMGLQANRAFSYYVFIHMTNESSIYRTDDAITLHRVFNLQEREYTATTTGRVFCHGVLCFSEMDGYMYAGLGEARRGPTGTVVTPTAYIGYGRVWRSENGTEWEQVFGEGAMQPCDAVTSIIQTVDWQGQQVLWISTGKEPGDSRIWQSANGITWTLVTHFTTPTYDFALSLADYLGEHYCSTGSYVANSQGRADQGDVWRIISSESAVEKDSATARWTSLLEKLQEKAEGSGQHDFGIVGFDSFLYCSDDVQTFKFEVRSPQWGTDNRWDGERGLIFQIERGNMAAVEYSMDHGTRPTVIYVLGASSGEERHVSTFSDALNLNDSPWNWVEGIVDAQGIESPSAVNSIGWGELEKLKPFKDFQFTTMETEQCHYVGGNDDESHPLSWGLGDIVTAWFAGNQATCKVREVAIHAKNGGAVYEVQPTFKVLEVEDLDEFYTVYLATASKGLYRSTDFTFDDSADPTWERVGQKMGIAEFAVDRSNPDEFQAARSGNAIYVRRPSHYGDDDWHSVLTKAEAETVVGQSLHGIKWVEINPQKTGHMYIIASTGINNFPGKPVYMMRSKDFGASWDATVIADGAIRAYGGIWAGNTGGSYEGGEVLYASLCMGGGGSANIYYSVNEGDTWNYKASLGSSVWLGRLMVDPTNQDITYAGKDANGPNLVQATTVNGGFTEIDGGYQAGIAISHTIASGWVSGLDGLSVRTYRNGNLYYSGDGGYFWEQRAGPFTTVRAIYCSDVNPSNIAVVKFGDADVGDDWNVLKVSSDTGKAWVNKSGINAYKSGDAAEDSVPYDCGGAAENGLFIFIP